MAQRGYLAFGFFFFFSLLSYPACGRDLRETEGLEVGNKNTSISHLSTLGLGWLTNLDGKAVDPSTEIRHWAILSTMPSGFGKYYGVKATLSVYGLPSITKGKGSATQIWIGDEHEGEVMQAGWHVMPDIYGDNDTHFYVYWTADRWQTGCYNLKCNGFVRDNSSNFIPGRVIRPLSKYNGDQYEITLKLLKNSRSGRWELTGGPQDKLIGYWPEYLFKTLSYRASRIDIGGTSFFHGGDLSPPLGSGHFAAEGQKKAAYIRNIKFVDVNGSLFTPGQDVLSIGQDKPDCYTITGDPKATIYYGGPGNCKN